MIDRLQSIEGFRRFALGVNRKSVVEKANAPDPGRSTVRSDQNEHVRGVEVAKATLIFVARILRNPVSGSARP